MFLRTAADTINLGRAIGNLCRRDDVILLAGELGGGKTTLTRGIATGLLVDERIPVTSPTFNLVHEYQGRLELFHLDLYRLGGEDELYEIGFDDYLERGGVTVIEWPDRLGALTPKTHLAITMKYSKDFNSRQALLAAGKQWRQRIERIVAAVNG